MKNVALIDADILCFRAAIASQTVVDFGGDVYAHSGDAKAARDRADMEVSQLMQATNAIDAVLCLSDGKRNWRKEFTASMPAELRYKANRSSVKPDVYFQVRAHVEEKYKTRWMPRLEADDVLGILATAPKLQKDKRRLIVVSVDKDLKTVPGFLYNPGHPDDGIQHISPAVAHRNHMLQTLMGDRSDNFPGCPGVGKVGAEKILDGAIGGNLWGAVVWAFEAKGLPEAAALVQARLARILQHGEYDQHTYEVKLWNPNARIEKTAPPKTSSRKTPASEKTSRRAPAGTRAAAKAASTSSRPRSSSASRKSTNAAQRSTAIGTGRKASRSRASSTARSDT